ncbi:unnamed protein product, partial [marine sediment metagenome]
PRQLYNAFKKQIRSWGGVKGREKMITINSKIIERIEVICPMEERGKAIHWMYENGYDSTVTGPMPTGNRKYDMKMFQSIALKDIKINESKTLK